MIAQPFLIREIWLHRVDARVKIIVAVAFALVVALAERDAVLLASLGAAALLAAVGRLPARPLAARLAALNVFVTLVWLTVPATGVGEVVARLGPVPLHADGLALAWQITLKANAILLVLTALLATSPVFSLVHGLAHLKVPDKLVQLLFFTWRYVHDIFREAARLRRAMKVRAFTPGTNLHTYRSYAYLIGTLLVRGFDRSERVYDAMVLRGFSGTLPAYYHPRLRVSDGVMLVAGLGAIVLLGVMEWT